MTERDNITSACKWIVSGRVQGVGFRFYTRRTALRLGVKGTVQNLPDGRVEVIAMGHPDRLAEMKHFLQQGPSLSRVTQLDEETIPDDQPVHTDFRVIY